MSDLEYRRGVTAKESRRGSFEAGASTFHEVPMHGVMQVHVSAFDDAYSHEFGVNGKDIEHGYAQAQADDAGGDIPAHLIHAGNDPKVQGALENSVRSKGMLNPIVVAQHADGYNPVSHSIQDGSHRLLAAKRVGMDYVPVRLTR